MKKTDRNHLSYRQQKKLMKLEHKLAAERQNDANAFRLFDVLFSGIAGFFTAFLNSSPKITYDVKSKRR